MAKNTKIEEEQIWIVIGLRLKVFHDDLEHISIDRIEKVLAKNEIEAIKLFHEAVLHNLIPGSNSYVAFSMSEFEKLPDPITKIYVPPAQLIREDIK